MAMNETSVFLWLVLIFPPSHLQEPMQGSMHVEFSHEALAVASTKGHEEFPFLC